MTTANLGPGLRRGDKSKSGPRFRRSDELQTIPGIGPSMAQDLRSLGIASVAELKGRNPQMLYEALNVLTHTRQDPCVLYTFRCAVYYASHSRHDPEKLKWWNWKDGSPITAGSRPRRG